jgi:hypothetical protein
VLNTCQLLVSVLTRSLLCLQRPPNYFPAAFLPGWPSTLGYLSLQSPVPILHIAFFPVDSALLLTNTSTTTLFYHPFTLWALLASIGAALGCGGKHIGQPHGDDCLHQTERARTHKGARCSTSRSSRTTTTTFESHASWRGVRSARPKR